MKLEAGILIVGSLYWSKDGGRQGWRERRLFREKAKAVRVPMRYGRLSKSGTYTMVFSADLPSGDFGQAKVVPCRNAVSSIGDLASEAKWLWAAEENKADCRREEESRGVEPSDALSRAWGYAALLVNPRVEKDPEVEGLCKRWAELVSRAYVKPECLARCLVSEDGLLQIRWPRLAGGGCDLGLDLLLATSNVPERQLPSVNEIVDKWNRDGGENVDYFWRNDHNGFRTFQDEAIKENLQRSGHLVCDRPAFHAS
jgi:hypothetical protein